MQNLPRSKVRRKKYVRGKWRSEQLAQFAPFVKRYYHSRVEFFWLLLDVRGCSWFSPFLNKEDEGGR